MTKRNNETSEEYIERCRIWEKEHRPNRCVETGEIFESAKKASEITSINNISMAARGTRKTAGGYHWEYL